MAIPARYIREVRYFFFFFFLGVAGVVKWIY